MPGQPTTRLVLLLITGLVLPGPNLAPQASTTIGTEGMACLPKGLYRPLYRVENAPKEVMVRGFWLDIYPVTNADFLEFVRANPRWRRSRVKRMFAEENYLRHWASDLEPGCAVDDNAPVTWVSWFAANAYAAWKGKRLPTVVEWEYAAAASSTRPDGENDPEFSRQLLAWYAAPAPQQLQSVGAGRANYFGVHDLHGLVWEWVADFSSAPATSSAQGDAAQRDVFCGGAAQGASDVGNYAAFMRFGFRSSLKADYTVHNLGFRCARDL
jgi:formylglycine-generating enzyme required for sulfatase activity